MEQVVDYVLVDALSIDNLAKYVKQKILQGWQPLGGVAAAYSNGLRYTQAMVRYEE